MPKFQVKYSFHFWLWSAHYLRLDQSINTLAHDAYCSETLLQSCMSFSETMFKTGQIEFVNMTPFIAFSKVSFYHQPSCDIFTRTVAYSATFRLSSVPFTNVATILWSWVSARPRACTQTKVAGNTARRP